MCGIGVDAVIVSMLVDGWLFLFSQSLMTDEHVRSV